VCWCKIISEFNDPIHASSRKEMKNIIGMEAVVYLRSGWRIAPLIL
jgi:hypothetical protein